MRGKRMQLALLMSGVALLSVLLVLNLPSDATAAKKPKKFITWSQSPITATVCPGDTFTTTVSFTSSRTLNDVSLHLTPTLADTTSITPDSFATVSADVPNFVQVSFTAPVEGERTQFNGALKVRTERRGFKRPLKLRFTIACGSATPTSSPTNPPTDTPTNTLEPPTATPTDTPTNTLEPPTPTEAPTNTLEPPTPTEAPTNTPTP